MQECKQKCHDFDVVTKNGHLMLEEKSQGNFVAFDKELKTLDTKWKHVLERVESQKKEVESTARKWWDFTRNKIKMMRWLNRKESDAGLGKSLEPVVEDPREQLNNYEVLIHKDPCVYIGVRAMCICVRYKVSIVVECCPFVINSKRFIVFSVLLQKNYCGRLSQEDFSSL